MNMKSIAIIAILVIAAGISGYFSGERAGESKSLKERDGLKRLVDLSFPPPPQETSSLNGKVTGIYGATINFEVDDPADYLPHPDGSARKKIIRFANTTAKTAFSLVDYTKIDREGNPSRKNLESGDIKTGAIITVYSDRNIRDTERFDAVKVELVKY